MNSLAIKERITKRIITALKNGVRPWVCPWNNNDLNRSFFPLNVVSKKKYQGVNPWLLMIGSFIHGFKSPWWGTFKQWKELGGTVKRRPANVPQGQWGTEIVFFSPIFKNVMKDDGKEVKEKFLIIRTYTVFNLDQCEGEALDKFRTFDTLDNDTPVKPDFVVAQQLLKNSKAKIVHGGDRAFYSQEKDFIQLPYRKSFKKQSEYFHVAFHELAHWMEPRLHWTGTYPLNELIAEITSCYVDGCLGMPESERKNHDAYLGMWLKDMNDDPRYIFVAAAQAGKVSNFLLNFVGMGKPEETEDGQDSANVEEADYAIPV